VVNPTSQGNLTNPCTGVTWSVSIGGGVPPYSIPISQAVTPKNGLPASFPTGLSSSGLAAFTGLGFPASDTTSTGTYKFTIISADNQSSQITISCGPNPPPGP
jgi:hypothetical protein